MTTGTQRTQGVTTHQRRSISGPGQDLGSLKAGKLVDIIVLDKNPLQDIRHSETIRYTIVNGRIFDAHTMDEIGNRPVKRKPLFFENDNRLTRGK